MTLLIPLVLLALAAAEPACSGRDAALPAELAGWAEALQAPELGKAFVLPATDGAASVEFAVAAAGRYRVGLDQPGWIDVVRAGVALKSVAHGHGPECSTIRKLVAFDLEPGSYTLRLGRLGSASAKAIVVRGQKE